MAQNPMMLLILSSIMAVSSFLAGALPLSLSLSSRQLRAVTQLGAGLLVGTALSIIIPEGVGALYDVHSQSEAESNRSTIGLALVCGFILMYLIDMIPSVSARNDSTHIPLSSSNHDDMSTSGSSTKHPESNATTIGLVVHAFADGIALGASSAEPSSVGLVVFAAIMMHKAPAAFGMTTSLLKQGMSKQKARAHLLLFSLAAPMGAFVTYIVVQALANQGKKQSANEGGYWTGVALVFSGGTFL
jgi:solute carrier family 39 (zinc transporter), member 9